MLAGLQWPRWRGAPPEFRRTLPRNYYQTIGLSLPSASSEGNEALRVRPGLGRHGT